MQEPSLENSISMAKCFDQTVKQFTAWITKFAFMLIDLIVKVVLVRYLARILQPGRHADQLGCKIFAKKSGPTSSEQGFLAEHDHKDRSRAEARARRARGLLPGGGSVRKRNFTLARKNRCLLYHTESVSTIRISSPSNCRATRHAY